LARVLFFVHSHHQYSTMKGREYLSSIKKLQTSYTLSEVVEVIESIEKSKVRLSPYRNIRDLIEQEFGTVEEFGKAIGLSRHHCYHLIADPRKLRIAHLFGLKRKGVEPVDVLSMLGEGDE